MIVDTGNSYQGLCSLIRQKTKGRDGIYFTYQEDAPVAFNPFFVEDGVYDVEKRESLKALLLTLWKRESEEPTRAEEVALSNAVNLYLSQLKTGTAVTPSFNTFYEFVATDYRRLLEKSASGKRISILKFSERSRTLLSWRGVRLPLEL